MPILELVKRNVTIFVEYVERRCFNPFMASHVGIPIYGQKLAILREDRALTQDALGQKIGMSKGGIANLEGKEIAGMNPTRFRNLAEFLGIGINELKSKIGAPVDRARETPLPASTARAIERLVHADDENRGRILNSLSHAVVKRAAEIFSLKADELSAAKAPGQIGAVAAAHNSASGGKRAPWRAG